MIVKEIPVVSVERFLRQRTELQNIKELSQAIESQGLINPITVVKAGEEDTYRLIAGGRRLEAFRYMGKSTIPAQIMEASDIQQQVLEFSENFQRDDLPWREKVKAFHNIRAAEPKEDLTKILGMSKTTVSKYTLVSDNIDQIEKFDTFSAAYNGLQRKKNREQIKEEEKARARVRSKVGGTVIFGIPLEERKEIEKEDNKVELLNQDFHEWAPAYKGEPFSVIHCDFPYGIRIDKGGAYTTVRAQGEAYEDTTDTYFNLIETLNRSQFLFAENCHMLFWFSMHHYRPTIELLERDGGWQVDPFPLIWDKTPIGIMPDSNRGFRRVYETIFFCRKGDPLILTPRSNSVSFSTKSKDHVSEKPIEVLEKYLGTVVDETTRFLDPTCGSGNALKVARRLKAAYSLGLEIDKDFYMTARLNAEK